MCFKAYKKWVSSKLKNITFWDIPLIKLSTAAFILMVAKLWTGLLALDWYWYLVIALVAAIKPSKSIFCKGKKAVKKKAKKKKK